MQAKKYNKQKKPVDEAKWSFVFQALLSASLDVWTALSS
jgi:hypothetical protein